MQDASIGIVLDPENKNKILWVKRRDLPIWVLPGGGIDVNETPEQAVVREVEEESGVIVSIVRKTAVYFPVNRWTSTTHLYLCQVKDGIPHPQTESVEAEYFSINSPPYPHFPFHDIWAKEAFKNPEKMIQRPLSEFSWLKAGCFFLKHPGMVLSYVLMRMGVRM